MKKRWLALLLALAMVVSLFPVALAVNDDESAGNTTPATSTTPDTTDNRAQIVGGQEYATLKAAVEAAKSGDTIQMLADDDVSTSGLEIPTEKSLTLDLNGKKIKAANTNNGNIKVYGTLTIKDSTDVNADGESCGKIYTETTYGTNAGYPMINAINKGASVTLESGFIDAASFTENPSSEGQFALGVQEGGNVTITGGKVEAGWYAVSGNGSEKLQAVQSTINIEGGTLVSKADYALYLPHNCLTTISGGVVTGASGGIGQRAGQLVIKGGTIASQDTGDTGSWSDGTSGMGNAAVNIGDEKVGLYNDVTVTITGGNFTAAGNAVAVDVGENTKGYDVSVTIKGGTFADDVSEYVPNGFKCTKDENSDTYKVGEYEAGQLEVKPGTETGENTVSATLDGTFSGSNDNNVEYPTGGDTGSQPSGSVSEDNTVTVTLNSDQSSSATTATLTVAGGTASSMAENDASLKLESSVGDLTVSNAALRQIKENATTDGTTSDVTLSISKTSTEESTSITYSLTAEDADGNEVFDVDSATDAKITVTVKAPTGATNGNPVYVYYIGENGAELEATPVVGENGMITWDVTHFSDRVVRTSQTKVSYTTGESKDPQFGTMAEALTAVEANGGTITLLSDVTLNGDATEAGTAYAEYALIEVPASENVTINGGKDENGEPFTLTLNYKASAATTTSKQAGAFLLNSGSTLTLNGVKVEVNGSEAYDSDASKNTNVGSGFRLLSSSDLILTNATVTLQNLSRGINCAETGTEIKLTGSDLTIQDLTGNASQGGTWTIDSESSVTISEVGGHGLSADSVTVQSGATVSVTDAALRGISINKDEGVLEIKDGASVTVTNCGNATVPAVYMAGSAENDDNDATLKVAKGGSLTVTADEAGKSSEIALSRDSSTENQLDGTINGTYTGGVALLDGKVYAKLEDAVIAANTNEGADTIELLDNVQLESKVTISADLTIIGNDKTITGDANNTGVYFELTGGTFNISDVTLDGFGSEAATASGVAVIKVPDTATDAVLNATNVDIKNFCRSAYDIRSGKFTITGGTIDCGLDENITNTNDRLSKGFVIGYGNAEVSGSITGCTITGVQTDYENWSASGIEISLGCTVTVKDTAISSMKGGISVAENYGPENGTAKVTVENCNISAEDFALRIFESNNDNPTPKGTASLTVNGGTYKGDVRISRKDGEGAANGNNSTITINSGKFTGVENDSFTDYLAGGLIWNADGTVGWPIPAVPSYQITITDADNGTVKVSPTAAKEDATVTITATPDKGYEVGTVSVTDRNGQSVRVTANTNGTYSFVMPDGQVTVTVTFVEGEKEPLPFTDVPETEWYYDEVYYVWENGLMNGVGDNKFAPNTDTSRAMFITTVWRMEGEPKSDYEMSYNDVGENLWYTEAVRWATANGIMEGYDGGFHPGDAMTREQLAAILYRYAQYKGYDTSDKGNLSQFTDQSTISGWSRDYMVWAVGAGMLQGSASQITPMDSAIRAQTAAILMRFIENVAK